MKSSTLDTAAAHRWKRYPEYRSVRAETLSQLPAHWRTNRLKFATRLNPEVLSEETHSDYELRYIDISNVDSSGRVQQEQTFRFEDAPSRARRRVRHGDVIISTVRTYLRAIAPIQHPPENLIVSTGFAVLRPGKECDPGFLWRLIQSNEFVDAVVNHSGGVGYPAINPTELGGLPIWLPPLPEQRAIAAFLDRETARLDVLIERKARLIALLEEKRQAVISQAIAQGLDPSGPRREASLPGLGLVPADWKLMALKRTISYITSGSRGWAEHYSDEGDWFIQSGNLNRRLGLDLAVVQRVKPPEGAEVTRTQIRRDDVLVCVTGAYTGNVAVVDDDLPKAFVNQHVALLRPVQSMILPKFLGHFLACSIGQWQFQLSQYGGTKQGLGLDDIRSVQLHLPSMQEQTQIVNHIDHTTARLDQLSFRIREGIARLQEYRTALISAAVTGQIDVRGEVE